MKFQEIYERCWKGYRQAGMKKKGDRMVPNCVPVEENQASPERNTAKSLAQDLKGWIEDFQEIQAAGLDSSNVNYIRKLKRNIETAHEQIRRLGYRFDSNNPDLVRLMGRPLGEVKIGPDMTLNDLLYTAAARAMRDAGREGIDLDYEDAIKQAAKIYGIPYKPSQLPKLRAQLADLDARIEPLRQQQELKKQQKRQAKYGTAAAVPDQPQSTITPAIGRIKPPTRTLESQQQQFILYLNGRPVAKFDNENEAEYQGRMIAKRVPETRVEVKKETCTLTPVQLQENLKQWFKEKWVRFGPDGKIRGACARGSESEGKPKCLPQSKAHALGKKGRASAAAKKRREDPNPERRGPARNVATKVREDANPKFAGLIKNIQARLKKDDYQRPEIIKRVAQMVQQADPTVPDAMATARELVQQHGQGPAPAQTHIGGIKIAPEPKLKPGETPQSVNAYWQALGQAPIRKTNEAEAKTYYRVIHNGRPIDMLFSTLQQAQMIARRLEQEHGGQARVDHTVDVPKDLVEKQDACYRKVKSRYKVWPSAYASGALVQCRKKGAANWGTGSKKK